MMTVDVWRTIGIIVAYFGILALLFGLVVVVSMALSYFRKDERDD